MRLLHYSIKPISKLASSTEQKPHMKPKGLWLSVEGDDDWDSWCRAEDFRNHDNYFIYEVELAENSNILLLDTGHAIDEFTREFSTTVYPGQEDRGMYINWRKVARKYDGIIIAPYQWSRRMETHCFWYYGWDCASGCIWRKRAVRRFIPVQIPPGDPEENERTEIAKVKRRAEKSARLLKEWSAREKEERGRGTVLRTD